jgi:dihydrodipicolinate synthase/N-acetylneuraminate lyase
MPVRPDDALDHDALARNIERWNETPLTGFVVGSGGGEEEYFSEAEKLESVRTVVAARGEDKYVIGGIDTPSSTEAIRLAVSMAEAGVDMVRVRIPQTPAGGNRGNVVAYYEEIASECPVPIVVIHQTYLTGGRAATPEEIGAICSLEGVFAYIFWLDVRFESYVRELIPDRVKLWIPGASLLVPGVAIGAQGCCGFFGNWAPGLVLEILGLCMAGKFDEAAPLQRKILRADYLGMVYGVRALKAGLDLLGYEGTSPRRPTPPLGPAETEELRVAFRQAGLLG